MNGERVNHRFVRLASIIIVLAVISACAGGVLGGPQVVTLWNDWQLARMMRTDPRYQVMRAIETLPYAYVIDVEQDTVLMHVGAGEVEEMNRVAVWIRVDVKQVDTMTPETRAEVASTLFVTAIEAVATAFPDTEIVLIFIAHVTPVKTFDGYGFRAMANLAIGGPMPLLLEWARTDGTMDGILALYHAEAISLYVPSPWVLPLIHTSALPRPSKHVPPWVVDWADLLNQD